MNVETLYMKALSRKRTIESRRIRGVLSLAESIRGANRKGSKGIIAEFKRRSLSGFVNRENPDLDAYLKRVKEAGVSAFSILTEPVRFGGTYEDLRAAQPYGLPVLAKDFISSVFLIKDAYNMGADCILLIADFLSRKGISDLQSYAQSLGMETLVEFHDPESYDRIPDTSGLLIGYNRRNLRSLRIEPDEKSAIRAMTGDDRLKVLESGLASLPGPEIDNFNAVLVGEAMLNGTFATVRA